MKTSPAPPPARTGAQVDDLVAELHRAHALTLVRMANLLLRDRHCAEDVVQDSFLSLATLGVSRGTVSSTASRALSTLGRQLKEDS
ncbi:MAG TPA: hypothetical protein VF979_07885 [Streptosporangiaceae bacterium]